MKVYLTEKQFKDYVHRLKEETVGELIGKLEKFPEDMNVDCNDGNGGYSSIKDVKKQDWEESGERHETVTIVHGKYDHDESVVESLCRRLMCEDTATPDHVMVYDENGDEIIDWYYIAASCCPIPFGYDEKMKLHVGQVGEGHSNLENRERCWLRNECGRLWQGGKYVTIWGGHTPSNRLAIANLYKDIKKFGYDISDSIFLYEQDDEVMAIPVIRYIGGGQGVPFLDYFKSKNNGRNDVSPWVKMPGESDAEKRENWYTWNGRRVDENKANKNDKGGRR